VGLVLIGFGAGCKPFMRFATDGTIIVVHFLMLPWRLIIRSWANFLSNHGAVQY